MNKRIIYILLFLIVVIAFLFRIWRLGEVPSSPNWDEVSLGYNAYSIMQTGKDEYGKVLPLILRSYDDYKPAVYAYFVIPAIKVFGLNVFAVRLPSALFGLAAVLATFFLVYELFQRFGSTGKLKAYKVALLASFLLAISPMSLQFSRIAFESNVGTAINIFMALFFIKGLRRPMLIMVSVILLGINLYVYQSEKVFSPILFLLLVVIFRKELFSLPKKYLILSSILLFVAFTSLVGFSFANKDIFARAKGVSVFSNQTEFLKRDALRIEQDYKNNDNLGLILDNRRVIYLKTIIAGYISHYDLNWLFLTGDLARHHAPGMGILYLFELPFLLIGMYVLMFGGFDKKIKMAIFVWFLIAPIPASITTGVPHAVRTLSFLPTFQIFIAIGILTSVSLVSNFRHRLLNLQVRYLIFAAYFLFLTFNFSYYLDQYFVQQNYFNSQDWQYGYKEAISEVEKIENKYDKIIVTNKPYLDQSYMFFLFYLKYSPLSYQTETSNISGGFRENHKFGKFEFRPIEWSNESKNSHTLFIGRANDFPNGAKVIKIINFLNGETAIKIVEG